MVDDEIECLFGIVMEVSLEWSSASLGISRQNMNNIIIYLKGKHMYHSIPYYFNTNYCYFYRNNQYYTAFPSICWAETHQNINLSQNNAMNQNHEADIPCDNIEATVTAWGTIKKSKNQEKLSHNINKTRKRQKGKQIESSKKNSESNIVNHILCFLGRENQSQQIVTKIINGNERLSIFSLELKQCFYSALKLINLKRGRRYVNIKTLLALFRVQSIVNEIPQIQQIMPFGCEIEHLCYLFRVSIFYFLRNMSDITILSSRRMNYEGKKIHLSRWRLITQRIISKELEKDIQQEIE